MVKVASRTERLLMLDALRGVAALVVVLYHIGSITRRIDVFERGYLAVDLFFILSGFVLTEVFEQRPFGSPLWVGAKRAGRLWPMMAAGTALGLLASTLLGERFDPATIAMALLFIPTMAGMDPLFPLNNVQWSLLSELLANLLHLVLLQHLRTRWIVGIAVSGWIMLTAASLRHGSLMLGPEGATWAEGLWRVTFGYPAGIALARTRSTWEPRLRLMPLAVAPLLLLAVVVLPHALRIPNAISDPLALLAFIAIILIGVRTRVPAGLHGAATWLGQTSFPLYAFHLPVLRVAAEIAGAMPDERGDLVIVAALLSAVAAASLAPRTVLGKGIAIKGFDRARPIRSTTSGATSASAVHGP